MPGLLALAHQQYNAGRYKDAHITCEQIYQTDAYRTDNLLLLGAIHFQLRNFSECIFYNQQAIRINPNFAGAWRARAQHLSFAHAHRPLFLVQRRTATWGTR